MTAPLLPNHCLTVQAAEKRALDEIKHRMQQLLADFDRKTEATFRRFLAKGEQK